MRKKLFTILFFVLIAPLSSYSASVKNVKGTQVLINLEGESFTVGQEIKARDSANKLRAILRVKKVGKNQAIAEVVKGKAVAGYTIGNRKPASIDQNADGSSSTDSEASAVTNLTRSRYGVLGSYLRSSMNANFPVGSVNYSTSMTGTGFGALGFYDFSMGKDLEIRGSAGLEQFSASETKTDALCSSSTSCNVQISYLSLYGLAKYKFTRGRNQIWGGGGMGYLYALSKSSTVLDTSQISANQVFTLALGADISMKNKQLLPLSIEYSLFPSSGTVTANTLTLRAGWGWGL